MILTMILTMKVTPPFTNKNYLRLINYLLLKRNLIN